MRVTFRESFTKDLSFIRDQALLKRIRQIIEHLENSKSPSEIHGIKKLQGSKTAYRIRSGDYRMGMFIEEGCIEVTRFLHRKEIYRRFP